MTKFDTIIVGTGFASSFFLSEYLERAGPGERILILERGSRHDHQWQLENRRHSTVAERSTFLLTGAENKHWRFNIGFGGGSNCWWACTPRMLPNDFRLNALYGVGRDWPIGYDDLEPFYQKAEELMLISGSRDGAPFPRTKPYPLPPHRLSSPDKLLKQRFPDAFFPQPTGRASIPTETRPQCCANGVCSICPVNAKFTIANDFASVYDDPRVTLRTNAEVQTVETQGGLASGVTFKSGAATEEAKADLVVVGANAIFNSYILLRSALSDQTVGKGVTEQVSINATAFLDGVDNFDGSTSITGHGYMLYDGPHRAQNAGCLIETSNVPKLRADTSRWRQQMHIKLIFEDIPLPENFVAVSDIPGKPRVNFEHYSDYAYRGIEWAKGELPRLLQGLPIERLEFADTVNSSEAHVIGGTPMGTDRTSSVVDTNLVHHGIRNLVILGSGVFPSCPPANPTLTLSALALRSASHLFQAPRQEGTG